jgi:hypothetical protein
MQEIQKHLRKNRNSKNTESQEPAQAEEKPNTLNNNLRLTDLKRTQPSTEQWKPT